jgi:hypothetical protein
MQLGLRAILAIVVSWVCLFSHSAAAEKLERSLPAMCFLSLARIRNTEHRQLMANWYDMLAVQAAGNEKTMQQLINEFRQKALEPSVDPEIMVKSMNCLKADPAKYLVVAKELTNMSENPLNRVKLCAGVLTTMIKINGAKLPNSYHYAALMLRSAERIMTRGRALYGPKSPFGVDPQTDRVDSVGQIDAKTGMTSSKTESYCLGMAINMLEHLNTP